MNMKLIQRSLTVVGFGFLILAGTALRADEGMKGGQKTLERMRTELSLSDDQFDKVKTEDKADRDAAKPLRQKMTLDIDSLKVLVDKGADGSDLKPAITKIKDDKADIETQKMAHRDALQQILTPLQQAKAILLMREHMQKEEAANAPTAKP